MVDNLVEKNTEEIPSKDELTCKGCASLSGDIMKNEEKKKTVILFYCLELCKANGHQEGLVGRFDIEGASLEDKSLPKNSDYPKACENHSRLVKEKELNLNEDIDDIE